VGSKLLAEALNRGHEVTGIVRHPERLPLSPRLHPQRGDVLDEEELVKLLAGHDVVISAVQFTMSDPRILIRAVKRAGVKRYVVSGGMGSLETRSGMQVVDDPEYQPSPIPSQTVHKDPRAEALAGREFLRTLRQETELNWTFISPSGRIPPGPRTGKFRIGGEQLLIDANHRPAGISQEDFAVAMLDEIENPQHTRQRFTVGY
jgi:putative NADH-flavin reductase